MVEEGTWAYLEISDSNLFTEPLSKGVVASAFANRQLYLVLANYNHHPVEVKTADAYVSVTAAAGVPEILWKLQPRTLLVLRLFRASQK